MTYGDRLDFGGRSSSFMTPEFHSDTPEVNFPNPNPGARPPPLTLLQYLNLPNPHPSLLFIIEHHKNRSPKNLQKKRHFFSYYSRYSDEREKPFDQTFCEKSKLICLKNICHKWNRLKKHST